MKFHEILKELRVAKNITQKDLAKTLSYSQSVICEWEKGATQPTAPAIILLAKYFNVSTDYLLGNENDFGIKTNEAPIRYYTQEEQQLIAAYRAMSPGKKQALFSMLDIGTTINKKQTKE